MGDIINADGSVQGKTFSGPDYTGEHPSPKEGETYGEYHDRVQKAKAEGFHLGDLDWGDWHIYCDSHGYNSKSKSDIIE
jgi:hypothetical protein